MTSRCIELHDSRVVSIIEDGGEVTVELDAYVHASDGRPGIDAGEGWSQSARLVFSDGEICERPDGDRLWIVDGVLHVGRSTIDGEIPIPLDVSDTVELSASGAEGSLRVRGSGARLVLVGEPTYVEPFDP